MTFSPRSLVAGVFCLLVLLCAIFPPRHYAVDTIEARPRRGFLFSSDLYAERSRYADGAVVVASTRIDAGGLLAEVLVLGGLAGVSLVVIEARRPRA